MGTSAHPHPSPLRVGLIGLGGIGRYHLTRYPQVPEAQVVAVADVRVDDLRADTALGGLFETPAEEVRWFSDHRDLIASGLVDAVDICLPTDLHRQAAVDALQGGLHVLCEKPMALTLEDCDAMLAAAEKSGRTLMVAHCIRFWPEYEYLRQTVAGGEAGRLLSLNLVRQGRRPSGSANAHWMSRVERSGGAIYDLHIHDVDYIHSLLGLPARVYAQGAQSHGASGGYDHVLANLDYGAGLQVSAAAIWTDAHLPFSARYEAAFERALLRFDSSRQPTLTVYRADTAEPEHPEMPGPDAYVREVRYFAQRVLGAEAPARCLARDARNSIGLVQAELASIAGGTVVDTRPFVRED